MLETYPPGPNSKMTKSASTQSLQIHRRKKKLHPRHLSVSSQITIQVTT